ncbi:CRISPR-associated helicase, Cas3 family [Devosia enhydra]|uniref:CRISPR-associated helicase, Cas3 family n=1 Tax=Devosia enhydra TaxID=665118 RepID=A0A1K2I3G2_9HYPH|nr:CRISPR-associated helicase/endonuclease Cas3 [Devosia enhydra]SFZ86881.1 CRISPR-associated helicase, Cas3 family [Devosia enhydra]
MYFAHTTDAASKSDWEPLPDHLADVADAAGAAAAPLGLEALCRVAGLLHDLGKYNPAFQRRLEGATDPVDHSTAGAALVQQLYAGRESVFAQLIAYGIAGHHAGLPDGSGAGAGTLVDRVGRFESKTLDAVWTSEITLPRQLERPDFCWITSAPNETHEEKKKKQQRFAFQLAMLGRMIFSALVDADFKATEAFYCRIEGRAVDRDWPALSAHRDDLIARLDARLAQLSARGSPVADTRSAILAHVRNRAELAPGLFTLTVPTGGGKTLTSLAFALDHAKIHGQRRIIYAIPFTAIIDQTAGQFRDILGADMVLEHHSALETAGEGAASKADSEFADRGKLRLAMEDWAAPVVVTTTVQLFESLFASRTSSARKLHNIARSVIVLDEAQTLPRPLLLPTLRAIEVLARDYGCTIVLCTATQPALDERHLTDGLPLEGRELAPDPIALSRQLRRVTLRQAGPLPDAELVEELAMVPQGLVIVNSRKHAMALFDAARAEGLNGLHHLSTRMCAAHRKPLLDTIRARLADGAPCRVISTSLIEAGVDVDFPRVWRAEAGLDQVAQAAGRCNREGCRPLEESIVTLFEAPDNAPPREITQLSAARKRMQDKYDDLFSPDAMTDYFREVYWQLGPERLDRGAVDGQSILGKFVLDAGRADFSYRSAAENFRMIESGMVPVIIPLDDAARRAIAELAVEAISSGRLARALQTYTVQVPPKARQRLIMAGRVRFEAPHLRADQFAVLTDMSLYRPETGLVWEDAEYLGTEALLQV